MNKERDLAAVAEFVRALEAKGPHYKMTLDELMEFARLMPKMPEDWTSADDIREMRGPLPFA
ncbi:MAG TPA: hypothetical protein VE010_11565 [Thermoanaerobaculia bacterium]|nr:hypothetical protein [Thermoanaerobaculia bacterium]